MTPPITMCRRPVIPLLTLATILLTACHDVEKNFGAELVLARLPSPDELNAIPLGETRDETRHRFGSPYWISEYHGELCEQFSVCAKSTPATDERPINKLNWPEPAMSIRFIYQKDATGIWRTNSLHWWQNGSTERTQPIPVSNLQPVVSRDSAGSAKKP